MSKYRRVRFFETQICAATGMSSRYCYGKSAAGSKSI